MPNIKSAKKRVSLSRAANEKNKMEKSVLKTTIKKFDAAVAAGDKTQARRCCRCRQGCEQGDPSQEQCSSQEEQHGSEDQRDGVSNVLRRFGSGRDNEQAKLEFSA